jgi:hypothetical protein
MEKIPFTDAAHLKIGYSEIGDRYGVEGRQVFFNYVDLSASRDALIAEILNNGLLMTAITRSVSLRIKASANGGGYTQYSYDSRPVPINVAAEVAERLVDLILANRRLITIDLTDTSLFDPIWQRFGWENAMGLRIFIVLSNIKRNYYKKYLKQRADSKHGLAVASVVAFCLLLLPVGLVLRIVGTKMSLYGDCDRTWPQLFPTESGVPVPTITDGLNIDQLKDHIVRTNNHEWA